MKKKRERAVDLLRRERCSCVVIKDDITIVCRRRGVKDLYELLVSEPQMLRGAFVADKVVGKGAAALMVVGGVAGVWAGVASRAALAMLRDAGIAVECRREVPHIINRARTDWCPVEKRCAGAPTAEACLPLIEAFLAETNPSAETT